MFKFLLATISGVLFALAFPNAGIAWLIFIALAPLLVALARARGWRESFALGWVSQTVAWLIMVPWVVRVMSHYGGLPLFAGILIFIAMCLFLGLYGGLFAFLVWRIAPGERFARWLLVPLAWAAVEYARTYLLTGFPWNLIAASIIDYTPLVQFDRVAGPYALGVLILLPTVLLAWLIVARPRGIRRTLAIAGFLHALVTPRSKAFAAPDPEPSRIDEMDTGVTADDIRTEAARAPRANNTGPVSSATPYQHAETRT